MKITLSQSEFCLSRRQILSLADGAGVRIVARSGVVWVTQDHDRRDIVLGPGESFAFQGAGQVIVQAMEPALVVLSQDRHAARKTSGWFEGLIAVFVPERGPQPART